MARYKYIGPPAEVLLLPDGYRVESPATQDGERLEDMIERHPHLARYYTALPKRQSKARTQATDEEE